jgi:GTP cyclohydrolase IA
MNKKSKKGVIESNLAEHLVYQILGQIGENPNREGLLKTPERVVRSWDELYCGYYEDPADLLTTFHTDGSDQMVLLKNIEMYSMCEHHMLPFIGKAHIAYIPKDGVVIGISKLARLLEIYARRLQIQERIGNDVTEALMKYLNPLGAACVIEAQHLCMQARGVGKQKSIMVTSSLKGVFLDKPAAREELFMHIARK